MKRFSYLVIVLFISSNLSIISNANAAPVLFDFGLNVDGMTYCALGPCAVDNVSITGIPGLDSSEFDFATGLGTLTLTLDPGMSGAHNVSLFLDHEIDESVNGFANEFGEVIGSPDSNQRFEIDEPGYLFGNLFNNFLDNSFDNDNGIPSNIRDDVAMGLGWQFMLDVNQLARMSFQVSDIMAPSGFHLRHIDPDSAETLYFSSTLEFVDTVVPVPEPSTAALWLFGSGLLVLLRRRRVD